MPPPPATDAKEVFRTAACFEFSGVILGSYSFVAISFLANAGRLPVLLVPPPTETQTAGGIFLPPQDLPPMGEAKIMPDQFTQIPTAIPTIVIQAFATELYLKCLLARDGKSFRSHKVHELFSELTHPQRTRIEQLFNEICLSDEMFQGLQRIQSNVSFTLDFALREMNNAFPDWRYPYELPGPQNSFLGQPWLAIKRYILELEPTWQSIVTNLGTPPTFQRR